MKRRKAQALFAALGDFVDAAVELGAARQRAEDAHDEFKELKGELTQIGNGLTFLITGKKRDPKTVN